MLLHQSILQILKVCKSIYVSNPLETHETQLAVHALEHVEVELSSQLVEACHVAQRILKAHERVLGDELLHLVELVTVLELSHTITVQEAQIVKSIKIVTKAT